MNFPSVTGASSGLGKAAVQEVIASGERVAAVTRKASALDDMVAQYGPSNLLVIEFDISKDKHVIPIFDKIKQHFGRLDGEIFKQITQPATCYL